MYGNEVGTAGGATLALTGLATGSLVLAAVGLFLAGVAVYLLVRKDPKHRP